MHCNGGYHACGTRRLHVPGNHRMRVTTMQRNGDEQQQEDIRLMLGG